MRARLAGRMDVNERIESPLGTELDASVPRNPNSLPYDTLSTLDLVDGVSLSTFTKMLWQQIRVQPDVFGVTLSGSIAHEWPNALSWGVGIRFGSEVFFCRSIPHRRIGQPLRVGETRVVSLLLCTLVDDEFALSKAVNAPGTAPGSGQLYHNLPPTHGTSRVRIVRLFRQSETDTMAELLRTTKPSHDSYGCRGVPILPIHLHEHQGGGALQEVKGFSGRDGHHVLFSAHAQLYDDELAATIAMVNRDYASTHFLPSCVQPGAHLGMMTASLAGVSIEDISCSRTGARAIERFTHSTWCAFVSGYIQNIEKKIKDTTVGGEALTRNELTNRVWRARSKAILACNNVSLLGILDILSEENLRGATPDDLKRPNTGGLIFAVAVRLACFPHRFPLCGDLMTGSVNDVAAARRTAEMFEAATSAVTFDADREPLFAIDILLNSLLCKLQNDTHARSADTRHEAELMRARVKESLTSLQRQGQELLVDVMGVLPQNTHGRFMDYEKANATVDVDPLLRSRSEGAWSLGLGQLAELNDTPRVSSRSERLVTLRKLLLSVEVWLRSGKFLGRVLLNSLHDGNIQGPMPRVDLEDEPAVCKPAAAESLKKPKKAVVKSSKKKNNETTKKAVESAKKRSAEFEQLITASLSTMAFSIAQQNLETLLTHGLTLGLNTQSFNLQTFLVTPSAGYQCSACPRSVHVLDSLMGGALSKCYKCQRRRCAQCSQAYMTSLEDWNLQDSLQPPEEPVCLFCKA